MTAVWRSLVRGPRDEVSPADAVPGSDEHLADMAEDDIAVEPEVTKPKSLPQAIAMSRPWWKPRWSVQSDEGG
ncbi:MAG: hypothetical protein H0T14_08070 [Nocardioidaceae bacterium]|nr:hypothetical protein [Nocardioidaceae bacterium]